MLKKTISIVCVAASIIFMVLPYGVPDTWQSSSPTGKPFEYYSYFSMRPFEHGNWFPMIIAVLSIIVLIVLLLNIKKTSDLAVNILLICFFLEIITWMAFGSFTLLSLAITVFQAIACAIEFMSWIKQKYPKKNGSEIAGKL